MQKRLILVIIAYWLVLHVSPTVAQSPTALAYSDDPTTAHFQTWGPHTVIFYSGTIGAFFSICRSDGTCTGTAQTLDNPASMGGFDWIFSTGSNAQTFTLEPGEISCTLTVQDQYRYCGVGISNPTNPIVDADDDGVGDSLDVCPTIGSMGSGVFENGCPIDDSDNDNITDDVDRCPFVFGVLALDGCPLDPLPVASPIYEIAGVVVPTPIIPDQSLQSQEVVTETDIRLFIFPQNYVRVGERVSVQVEISLEDSDESSNFDISSPPVEVYRYIEAEISGNDLNNFIIENGLTSQTLRLRDNSVEDWVWNLSPISTASVGVNLLQVKVYALTPAENGAVIRQEIDTFPIRLEVQHALEEASPTAPSESINQPTLGIIYYSDDSFTLVALKEFDFSSLKIRSAKSEVTPITDFDFPTTTLPQGFCLRYIRHNTVPPLPSQCQPNNTFTLPLGDTDIFWYQMAQRQLLPVIFYYDPSPLLPQLCVPTHEICYITLN